MDLGVARHADRLPGDGRLASGAASAARDVFALVVGRPDLLLALGSALPPDLGAVAWRDFSALGCVVRTTRFQLGEASYRLVGSSLLQLQVSRYAPVLRVPIRRRGRRGRPRIERVDLIVQGQRRQLSIRHVRQVVAYHFGVVGVVRLRLGIEVLRLNLLVRCLAIFLYICLFSGCRILTGITSIVVKSQGKA